MTLVAQIRRRVRLTHDAHQKVLNRLASLTAPHLIHCKTQRVCRYEMYGQNAETEQTISASIDLIKETSTSSDAPSSCYLLARSAPLNSVSRVRQSDLTIHDAIILRPSTEDDSSLHAFLQNLGFSNNGVDFERTSWCFCIPKNDDFSLMLNDYTHGREDFSNGPYNDAFDKAVNNISNGVSISFSNGSINSISTPSSKESSKESSKNALGEHFSHNAESIDFYEVHIFSVHKHPSTDNQNHTFRDESDGNSMSTSTGNSESTSMSTLTDDSESNSMLTSRDDSNSTSIRILDSSPMASSVVHNEVAHSMEYFIEVRMIVSPTAQSTNEQHQPSTSSKETVTLAANQISKVESELLKVYSYFEDLLTINTTAITA